MSSDSARPVLDVSGLSVSARSATRPPRPILDDVTFRVLPRQAVGVVGESGSGKSTMSLAILGILPRSLVVDWGTVRLHGEDLLTKSKSEMRSLRGRSLSMVLQDPMTSLDPSFTIGDQLSEAYRRQRDLGRAEIRKRSIEALARVRIASPDKVLEQYPHQLSGGMRQRVLSAISLAGNPDVLIADEPTTALDVTTQAQYLAILKELQDSSDFSLILVTHDLFVIRQMCEWIVVMYAGQVVEQGPLADVVQHPMHPYTKALFDTVPRLGQRTRLETIPGQAPDPGRLPKACRFAPRCPFARETCTEERPLMTERAASGRSARCHGTAPDGWIDTLRTGG